jgi:hypothetical protein
MNGLHKLQSAFDDDRKRPRGYRLPVSSKDLPLRQDLRSRVTEDDIARESTDAINFIVDRTIFVIPGGNGTPELWNSIHFTALASNST